MDFIFVLGLYKLKFFILSYAINLKLHCVAIVEEQIKVPSTTSAQVMHYVPSYTKW